MDGIFRGEDDRNSDHAGISDYAELLYYGKEYEQWWSADGKRYCNNDIDGGVYVDRMDFFAQNIRLYRLVRGKKIHSQQKVSFYESTDYFEV